MSSSDSHEPLWICLTGSVDSPMVEEFDRQVEGTEASSLIIVISSHGGFFFYAQALSERIRLLQSEGKDVQILVVGLCNSAAIIPLLAVPQERCWATVNSTFFIHPVEWERVAVEGSLKEMEIRLAMAVVEVRELRRQENLVQHLLAKRSGKPRKEVEELTQAGLYLSVREAMEFGLIKGEWRSPRSFTAEQPLAQRAGQKGGERREPGES